MSESYNICLDVGGTKVLGAIFNEKKEIIYRLKKKSKGEGNSTQNVEKVIVSVVEEMIEESGISKKDIHAISSSAPGVIDQKDGVVLFTPNLPWRNYEIKKAIDLIEKQIDALEEREDDMTKEQRKEFSNLNGRYTKLLVKIQLYLWAQELFDTEEVESTIEYIKGLLGANASGLLSE